MAQPNLGAAGAAVLIVLRDRAGEIETLLIQRTTREDDRASGQVSLPGGRVQPSDSSLAQTALRELEEEVGLRPVDLSAAPRFVGIESSPIFQLDVAVYCAALDSSGHRSLRHDPQEVQEFFWLPRARLAQTTRIERNTRMGPRMVDAVVYGNHVVWGFTLRVLLEFFRLGPSPPNPRARVGHPKGDPPQTTS